MSRASRSRSPGFDLGSCRTGYGRTSVPSGMSATGIIALRMRRYGLIWEFFCCSVVPSVNADPLYNPSICRTCVASSSDAQCWLAILSRDSVDEKEIVRDLWSAEAENKVSNDNHIICVKMNTAHAKKVRLNRIKSNGVDLNRNRMGASRNESTNIARIVSASSNETSSSLQLKNEVWDIPALGRRLRKSLYHKAAASPLYLLSVSSPAYRCRHAHPYALYGYAAASSRCGWMKTYIRPQCIRMGGPLIRLPVGSWFWSVVRSERKCLVQPHSVLHPPNAEVGLLSVPKLLKLAQPYSVFCLSNDEVVQDFVLSVCRWPCAVAERFRQPD